METVEEWAAGRFRKDMEDDGRRESGGLFEGAKASMQDKAK